MAFIKTRKGRMSDLSAFSTFHDQNRLSTVADKTVFFVFLFFCGGGGKMHPLDPEPEATFCPLEIERPLHIMVLLTLIVFGGMGSPPA